MQIIPIEDLLDILRYGRPGTVREAEPDEKPDFVQKKDKNCTGMSGRNRFGVAYSFDLNPPVLLKAGVGYIVDVELE